MNKLIKFLGVFLLTFCLILTFCACKPKSIEAGNDIVPVVDPSVVEPVEQENPVNLTDEPPIEDASQESLTPEVDILIEKEEGKQTQEQKPNNDEPKQPIEPEAPNSDPENEEITTQPEPSDEPEQGEMTVPHDHMYDSVVIEPTCTEQGYTTFTCSCGDSYQDQVKPAAGHLWGAWETTKEPTTESEGEKARICSSCQMSEHQPIEKLPSEETTEPVGCQHEWEKKYHAQVGHYGDYYNVCKCGWRFDDPKDWETHVMEAGAEAVFYHTSWCSAREYIIDTPAYYEWICAECGETRDTEP